MSSTEEIISGYAAAMAALVKAEGNPVVGDELYRFGQALDGNDQLRSTLADPYVPAVIRQQIVEDLLGGKAAPLTTALVGMAVGAGRAADLPAITRAVAQATATAQGREVAEVRVAVDLSTEQRERLAASLKAATGKDVDLKVTIDPGVLGGVIAQIGDTVIDGSVRTRLTQVKNHLN